ncbi:MAG: hypothetical protein K2X00_10000 [Nitrospiraceae bacterium]|nr:hypothetical protein [Nitrospiraceae bacterium]
MSRSLNITGVFVSLLLLVSSGHTAESISGPAELHPLVQAQSEALGTLSDNAAALSLFTTKVGPALGLQDVASTVAAKNIPPKVAKELAVQELTASAQRLIANLAAWQTADRITQSLSQHADLVAAPSATVVSWIQTTAAIPSLAQTMKELTQLAEVKPDTTAVDRMPLALSAGRLALDAQQRAIAEWWQLRTWKDRVRTVRGRNKLCGTWQWIIHNHQQHHQEQKLALLFPPPGPDHLLPGGLVETVVLGENVYLRWESNGQAQEDSLQFTKEGKGLEGTFVNSQGGWGSISGKRTSDCKP